MYSILAAYLILIAYYAISENRRKGQAATKLEEGQFDKGSTRLLSLALVINIALVIIANALNYLQIGIMLDVIGWIGIAVMLCGIALRVWATQMLGRFYTRTLRISEGQRVVQDGPYKYVRHPGYLGVILLWVGAGLATINWIVAVLVTLTFVAAYRYRINAEERMLVTAFGDQYAAYVKHTWRLLPFIW
jgi:protein-S-isoprenylcysteine O-methyltransferase Ste14